MALTKEQLQAFIGLDVIDSKSIEEAIELLEDVIQQGLGTITPERQAVYKRLGIGYDKECKMFVVFGDYANGNSALIFKFSEDLKVKGFDATRSFHRIIKEDKTLTLYMEAIKSQIDNQKKVLLLKMFGSLSPLDWAVSKYTETVRFGNEDYLTKELNDFIQKEIAIKLEDFEVENLDLLSSEKLEIEGQIIPFIAKHNGNINNVHITQT